MTLSRKVVVVTGSTYGIGRAIARGCGLAGARVMVSSRRLQSVAQTVESLEAEGIDVGGQVADVRDPDALEALLEAAIQRFGRVDVWVNNAGLGGGYRPLDDFEPEEIEELVETNVTGTMLGCRLMVPYFREHGGIILNLAGRGSRGDKAPFGAAYAATKAAVTSLTRSIAAENKGLPISIHEIMPGMVRTGFYENMVVGAECESSVGNIDVVLDAIGVPEEEVGRLVARVAAQHPGHVTGKTYSAFTGWRRVRGIARIAYMGMTGRMKQPERTPHCAAPGADSERA